jgi:hypothetical protein
MRKIFFLLLLLSGLGFAQTGIGTTTPVTKLHVKSNGPIFRLEGTDHSYMELFPQGSSTRFGYLGFGFANSTSFSIMNQFPNGALTFGTNGTNKMFLNSDGKLGLGTSTPGTSLHIENGNTFGTPAITTSPSIYVMNTNNASSAANSTIAVRTAGTGGGKPYYSLDISGSFGYSMGINNPTDQMIFNTSWDFNTTAANNAITINRSGRSRVVIPEQGGATASDWPIWGGGLSTYDICAASIIASNYITRSDRRLKNTIQSIDNSAVTKYLNLRPVTFYWNQDKPRDPSLQFGLIAQEVEPLFPEMVNTGTDEMQTKSVNYQSLHALSLKVIQEQQKQIEILQQKQATLEQRLLLLESKK